MPSGVSIGVSIGAPRFSSVLVEGAVSGVHCTRKFSIEPPVP